MQREHLQLLKILYCRLSSEKNNNTQLLISVLAPTIFLIYTLKSLVQTSCEDYTVLK